MENEIESTARLGESLSKVLSVMEDLGLDDVPSTIEVELRRLMNLGPADLGSNLLGYEAEATSESEDEDDTTEDCSSAAYDLSSSFPDELLGAREPTTNETFANLVALVGVEEIKENSPALATLMKLDLITTSPGLKRKGGDKKSAEVPKREFSSGILLSSSAPAIAIMYD